MTTIEFNSNYDSIRLDHLLSPAASEAAYLSLYQRIKDSQQTQQITLVVIQLHLQATLLGKTEAATQWLSLATNSISQLNSKSAVKAAQMIIKKNEVLSLMMRGEYVKLIGMINRIEELLLTIKTAPNTHLLDDQIWLDQRDVAKIYLLFGGALYYTSDFNAAQQYIQKSLAINQAVGDLKGVADGYNNLALIAMEEQQFEDATDFLNESLKVVKQIGDTEQYITFLTNQGVNFKNMGKRQEAIESFHSVINHPAVNAGYRGYKIHSLLMLADMYMSTDLPAAETLIYQAADVASELAPSQLSDAKINAALAQLMQHKGQHQEAIELAQQNLQYYQSKNKLSAVADSHRILSDSYQQSGQWQQAYEHFKSYAELAQEIEQNALKNSVTKLHSQYKENAAAERIAHLQTENQLKSVEIKANKKQKMVIVISGVFTLLTLLLLVSRHYIKKEAERLELHNSQIAAREKQLKLLSHAFKSTSDAVWITNDQFEIEDVNDSYVKHTLREKEQVVGKQLVLAPVKGQDEYMSKHIMKQVRQNGTWRGELYDQRADGQIYPLELEIEAIKNDAYQVIHYLGVFRDITEKQLAEQELKTLATHDHITGLPNRTLLLQVIRKACNDVKNSTTTLAVLLIDVNGYKKINDTVGHTAGDELIVAIAERIKAAISENEVFSRINDATFCVLIEHAEPKLTAVRVALEINAAFESAFVVMDEPYIMPVSMGITLYPEDGREAEDLLRRAQIAILDKKSHQNYPYSFYKHKMNEVIMAELSHEQRVIKAINNDSFEFYYQPLLDVSSGQIIGAEALIRWVEVDGSLVLPDQFIQVAERAGLIEKIDTIAIDQVFNQVARWQQLAHLPLGLVSINLSGSIFSHPKKLLSLLDAKISEHGVDPGNIKIEITENILLGHTETAIATIKQVKAMGFQIALDDFGTGYSSLNYLKKFEFDYLKIDRSFIMNHDKNSQIVVQTVIELAHSLKLYVVAEGIEDQDTLHMLIEKGCDAVQGYHICRPDEPKIIEKWYSECSQEGQAFLPKQDKK